MASDPEPGALATLSVPLVAGALAALLAASGADVAVFRAVNAWPAATGDALWANLTLLGKGAAVFGLAGWLAGRRPRLLLAALFAALLTTLTLHSVKDLVGASRPVALLGDEVHVIGQTLQKRSFPSGHACTAFAAAALLCCGLLRGAAARAALLALASLVSLSRLAVGAHWPKDVLAGAALGWLCGCVALRLALRRRAGPGRATQIVITALSLLAAASLAWPDDDSAGSVVARPVVVVCGLLLGGFGMRRLWRERHDTPGGAG